MPGELSAQDEQAGGAPGSGAQGKLDYNCCPSPVLWHHPILIISRNYSLIWTFEGEDIWGPRHLREGAQLSAAGVCHQRHHCQSQVCGLGAQWGAGAWDKCDQGPGLALHLKLHPQHWRRVPLPGWILIEDNLSSVYFWFWNLLFVICLHPIFMIRCNTEVSLNHECMFDCLTLFDSYFVLPAQQ